MARRSWQSGLLRGLFLSLVAALGAAQDTDHEDADAAVFARLQPKPAVTPAPPPPGAEPHDAAEPADAPPMYRLRVGDQLAVRIYGEIDSLRTVTVDASGQITYLLVGQIDAAGKTIPEVRDEMQRAVEKRLKHGLVTLAPVRFGGLHYTITGQVQWPGRRPLEGETNLLEAICRAGGWATGEFRNSTVDLADLDHSFLMRDDERVPVDFAALVEDGDMSQNVMLEPGDYIYIASGLVRNVYVLGEVVFPRILGFRTRVSLIEALTQARGLTPRAAKQAVIVRGSLQNPERFIVRTDRILDGTDPDVLLRSGDIVYVPVRDTYKLEELSRLAINAFVGVIASDAASWTWNRKIEPHLPRGRGRDDSNRDVDVNVP